MYWRRLSIQYLRISNMLFIRRILPHHDAHSLQWIQLYQVRLTDFPLCESLLNQGEGEGSLNVESEPSLLHQSYAFFRGEEVVVGCCGHLFVVEFYGYWVCCTLENGARIIILGYLLQL